MKQIISTLLFVTMAFAAIAQSGTVRGTVTDNLGLVLPGANVSIESQNLYTVTDVNGKFILNNVPAGAQELLISYIGYGEVKVSINVTDGETTISNAAMEPGVQIGEEVLVLGDRLKGQAKAINQQKNNTNITNIVAADQIGRFPDANIGDAMKRIQGITIQGDQGEARNIIIRGLAPQLNSVMINGERIPSAEAENRNIQLDLIPSDMVQTVEVNKAVTPDMDADAIGGSVNLVTRSAPAGYRVSGTLASGVNFLTNEPIWTGSLVLANRFSNDRVGIIVAANYNQHDLGSDNVEMEWADEAENDNEEDVAHVHIAEMDVRQYYLRRTRRSVSANLDFKIDNNNTIYLQSMYNWRDDWETRYRLRYTDVVPVFDANDDVTGYQGIIRRQTKAGGTIYNDRLDDRRLEDQRVANVTLRGEHLIKKLKIDWNITYARASEDRPYERYVRYEQGDDIPLAVDFRNEEFPTIQPQFSSDATLDMFELDELTEENQFTKEEDVNGRIDLALPVMLNNQAGQVKAGFRVRTKTKSRSNDFFEFGALTDDYENLAVTPNENYSKDDFLPGDQYDIGNFMTPASLANLDLHNTDLYESELKADEFLAGNFRADEDIIAAYLMWEQRFTDKLTAIIGARVENTSINYTGNIVENEEDLIREETADDSYTNFMPGVHLKYDVTNEFVLRAAWTNTIARPNYYDLVPFQDIRPDDEELIIGNPDLVPTTSMNFDLMAENYFQSIGLVSGGVFYKSIDNFIYTTVNESYTDATITGGDEWTRFVPENGGTATLFGAEIAVQRQLDFLPGALKGLGIYLNYTYTESNADGIRNEDGEIRDDIALPGTAPHLFNASLSYENKSLVLRVSVNYAADYVDEVGGSAFSDRFYDEQLFLDVNGSYAFTPNLRFFFELNNLTNQPLRYYQGVQSRTMQMEYYNARLSAGLKFDLFKKK